MHKLLAELSGGQRQRVALARALYQKKTIFIGDEPFSALDPSMADDLLKMVLARHSTVIMVLHDTSHALAHFDRIIGLREGELCLDVTQGEASLELIDRFYSDKYFSPNSNV